MAFLDLFDDRGEFFFLRAIDHVRVVLPDHFAIGRHHVDVEVVDLGKFRRFGVGRAGHAAEFLVHPEIVLKGDRGQRLIFVGDLDAFFGFDGLMQAVAPAAPRHQATGEFIDDDDFAVLHDIVHVPFVERIGLQRLDDVVDEIHVGRIVQVVHAEELFDAHVAVLGQRGGLGLFLDGVVLLGFELRDDRH